MVLTWTVELAAKGIRLDVFLSREVPGLSRSAAAREIESGAVVVKHRLAKAGLPLRAGDEIVYTPTPVKPAIAAAEPLPLAVIYQDEDLAVINKPAGMVTHPAAGHDQGTLVNAMLFHLDHLSGVGGVKRPGIVHRLDKETSGLLLVAKNDMAHQKLSQAIQARQVSRIYETLVWGAVNEERLTVNANLGRDPKDRKRFAVVSVQGKTAITHLQVLQRFDEFSWLQASLETGRTHQIRVHCHYLKHPVVGDRVYGKRAEHTWFEKRGICRPERQMLHARMLEFRHPRSGELLQFEAPRPDDFSQLLHILQTRKPVIDR